MEKILHTNNLNIAVMYSTSISQNRLEDKNCHKEKHYIKIKGPVHQEGVTIINIYSANMRAPKYMKQTLTWKEERKRQQHSNSRRLQYSTLEQQRYQSIIGGSVKKKKRDFNTINPLGLSQQQLNIYSSQVHMEHSPRKITFYVTKEALRKFRSLKYTKYFFSTTIEWS